MEALKHGMSMQREFVCDLNTSEAFPSVLDIKCSPVEPIFVSAAASKGYL
ncbi:hypothetical protein ACE6H2_002149 [Prunus campanulata]